MIGSIQIIYYGGGPPPSPGVHTNHNEAGPQQNKIKRGVGGAVWAGQCVMLGSPGSYSLALVSLTWAELGSSCLSPLIPRRSMLSLMLAWPGDGSMFSWPGSVSSSTSACPSSPSSRSPESSCVSP